MSNLTGYRRAAVELHALNEADRYWILDKLAEGDRTTLTQCLRELKELGFDDGASLRDECLPSTVPAVSPTQPFDRLRDATAAQLFAVLEHEPSSLIAQVMKLHPWNWEASFLQMFSAMRGDRIRAVILHTPDVAPALRDFLIETISARLQSKDGAVVSPRAAGRVWNSLRLNSFVQTFSPFILMVMSWKR